MAKMLNEVGIETGQINHEEFAASARERRKKKLEKMVMNNLYNNLYSMFSTVPV